MCSLDFLSGCSGLHPVPIACGGALRVPCDFVYIINHRRSGLYKIATPVLFISLASNLVVNLSNISHNSQQASITQSFNTSLLLDQTAGYYQTNQSTTFYIFKAINLTIMNLKREIQNIKEKGCKLCGQWKCRFDDTCRLRHLHPSPRSRSSKDSLLSLPLARD